MLNTEKTAGDHVEARCTRCRVATNHTIIAMVGDRPARVRCNTCGGDHNYRPLSQTKPAKAVATEGIKPARRNAADRRREALQEEWQTLTEKAGSGLTVPYTMERSFRLDDLIEHPTFGVGVVKAVIKPNKVEVLFASGTKSLRCKL